MSMRMSGAVILLAISAATRGADNPRHIDLGPGLTAVRTLEQNWSDEESNWFYNVPQGSRLIPYDWFLNLEEPDSQVRLRDARRMQAFGYITRTADAKNPDGLPVGFIKDEPYEDGTPALGFTCAACHTSQINRNGTAYLVDGGPGMGDFERLLKQIAAALQKTADDDAKFERFAAAVLPAGTVGSVKTALRASVRSVAGQRASYNDRNLPKLEKDHFAPGRVDAFGAIFNEVSVTFLGVPGNWRAANAPVSYPCLWDAPQHDRVQWNGAAENKVTPLGRLLFGTADVGALGRNSGEVLGVFGSADINAHELLIPRRYASTTNKANLMQIEKSLTTLWSPQWPFGNIDAGMRAKGEALFRSNCAQCHATIDRAAPDRRVVAHLSDAGTDQTLIRNFGRLAGTGRLKGRRKTLLGLERFGEEEPAGMILKHVVERVILNPTLNPIEIQEALVSATSGRNPLELIDALNPGYRMTATIDLGDKKLIGQFDSLVAEGRALKVGGGRFQIFPSGRDLTAEGTSGDLVDLRSLESVRAAAARLRGSITPDVPNGPAEGEQSRVVINNATAKVGYKARPLNGVWATAPYLHNGSVPSLSELLKPAAQRAKTFHVGSREYDLANLGFQDDPAQPLFDTAIEGNSNAGHEYGSSLSPEERRQLLEYLKSL